MNWFFRTQRNLTLGTCIAIMACLGCSVPAFSATKRGAKACSELAEGANDSVLNDLSLKADPTVDLPSTDLVYLHQQEGHDPFRFFQEGMDLENENPLSVTNRSGLSISVGGAAFNTSVDGSTRFEVKALQRTSTRQRFLVKATAANRRGYQILVNVDRVQKVAHVWMRERNGKWSPWELAGTYSSQKPNLNKAEDAAPPALPRGLIGEGDDGRMRVMIVSPPGEPPTLTLYRDSIGMQVHGRIKIEESVRIAILNGQLANLNGVEQTDRANELRMSVTGYDYKQNPTLTVEGQIAGRPFRLRGCNAWTSSTSL